VSETVDVLEQARRDLGLTVTELWFRYFAVGGMSTALELDAFLYGALVASPYDRDLLAVALNERFFELGRDHPMPYSSDREVADG
jgi:hypothetical protein